MLMSVLAAASQEGVNAISQSLTWAICRRDSSGNPDYRVSYGYRKDAKTKSWYVYAPEAERVRMAFQLAAAGKCYAELEAILHELEVRALTGAHWKQRRLHYVLTNEKYRGDALLQKSYVADILTHRRVRNDQGERTRYYVKGNHRPLLDPLDFDRAQRIRQLRCIHGGCPRYPYADRLVCPLCGAFLRQTPVVAQGARSAWFCSSCGGFAILTSYLNGAMLSAHCIEVGTERERIAYGWLDVLVGRVEFTREGIRVAWRSGRRTEVPIVYRYPRECPQHIAQLLRAQYGSENMEKGRE